MAAKVVMQRYVRGASSVSSIMMILVSLFISQEVHGFASTSSISHHSTNNHVLSATTSSSSPVLSTEESTVDSNDSPEDIFGQFSKFLMQHQISMIAEIEQADGSNISFSKDGWGAFENGMSDDTKSGGITRVIQGGNVVEKGACSLTIIRNGVLTADRAATISGRQAEDEDGLVVQEGDVYSAAALSVVLHTRNPYVPTFRSDVRIFLVKSKDEEGKSVAWFGGGSDLTPYYLIDQDIKDFHTHLKSMCDEHFPPDNNDYNLSYQQMKEHCDEYFYLPARSEHRGTGGIFFDDLPATQSTYGFVKNVAQGWMPSWLHTIVKKNGNKEYTDEEKHWQCLRRGRYLEFNLLYDRGVKFGLANANPRVEGVMVSAPPNIAFEYNHVPKAGSEEERLLKILKKPQEWV